MDRPHWSYSQIAQFLRCPLQFYFRRILGLKEETVSHQLVLGSSVHEALAHYHQGLQNGQTTTRDRIREKFRHAWDQRKAKDRVDLPTDKPEEDLLVQGEALLDAYLANDPPKDIVSVEQPMLVPIVTSQGEVLEKPLLAVADLITKDESGLRIHDFKTSSRTYSDFEASTSLQATCYVMAADAVFGQLASFRYTVLIKTKKAKVQHLDTARSQSDCGRLGDLIQTIERAVDSGIFFPNENPLNCSSCSFRRPCLDWGTSRQSDLIPLGLRNGTTPCSSNFTPKAVASASRPRKGRFTVRSSFGPRPRM